ncbi:MAG: FAD-binding protein, partial [Natronospirillum sp.]
MTATDIVPVDSVRDIKPGIPGPLLKGLRRILASQYILTTREALRPFECDGLTIYRQVPLIAVLPGNTTEVKAILRLCHELEIPVVTRGSGTGLSAGALPHREGLLLVLTRLDQILKIDTDNYLAVVQPGVRNQAISDAVEEFGLFYAPDPSSQITCSIGGNVAENAGGVHCLKYGLTVHNIARLKLLTGTGEEVILDAADNNAGFNFLALLIGSEGML